MWLWSAAMVAGIPDAVFWELSAPEVLEVLKRRSEDERREYLRVGLIAATILNVNRRPGAPMVHPEDFFVKAVPEVATVEEITRELDAWAASVNANIAEGA